MVQLFKKIKFSFYVAYHARSIESYIAYRNEKQLEDDCYDPVSNTCNGACQGCSECILARKTKGLVKFCPPFRVRYCMIESSHLHTLLQDFFDNSIELHQLLDDYEKSKKKN